MKKLSHYYPPTEGIRSIEYWESCAKGVDPDRAFGIEKLFRALALAQIAIDISVDSLRESGLLSPKN